MSSLKIGHKGDTIIEVLLAIIVLSMVLGGAFVSARRSLNATQQAKERDQAVRLIEAQIERLKSATGDLANALFSGAPTIAEFCLDNTLPLDNAAGKVNTGTIVADVNADNFDDPPYPDKCVLDGSNRQFNGGSESAPYYMSIQRTSSGPNLIFNVRARWDRPGGGREQAQIIYRFYK